MKRTIHYLTIILLFSTHIYAGTDLTALKIRNFSLEYSNEQGYLNFDSILIASDDIIIKNKMSELSYQKINNGIKLKSGSWEFILANFYKDILGEVDQLYLNGGNFAFLPGKKIYLNFDKAVINSMIYPKLLLSCDDMNEKVNTNDTYFFFKPCLLNGLLEIPFINLEQDFNGQKSLIPTKWKNIKIFIKDHSYRLFAKSANGIRAKLKVKGTINYDKVSERFFLKITKAKFGILSIKKTLTKLILKNIPNSSMENGHIVISPYSF